VRVVECCYEYCYCISLPLNTSLTLLYWIIHWYYFYRLVEDVLGETGNDEKVPMDKVVMLIWQFRDDPHVVTFMARFMAKYAGVRHVLDGIEFYLPQLAHMIIHLEVEWDDAILERFALVIAQQSIHFALQLNWILQGALQDYQPELADGTPNPTYNPKFYTRCLKLLRNVEGCVVYGRPRSQELQRLYLNGQINKVEMELLEQADRRFNALQITTKANEDFDLQYQQEGEIQATLLVRWTADASWVSRLCVLDRHVLNLYRVPSNPCASASTLPGKLDRAISLEQTTIQEGPLQWQIQIERAGPALSLRFASQEEYRLWLRRLGEETQGSTLFRTQAAAELQKDLSPAQWDRYKFFNNERLYVQSLTDLAESLRFKERDERKQMAPQLMAALPIPETVYLPLCNSSDIWRRVAAPVPPETRVFNTKARCPVIMYFLSKRGETMKRTSFTSSVDPNLDVAEFLHLYFDVPEVMEDVQEVENENGEDADSTHLQQVEVESVTGTGVTIKTRDDSMRNSEHSVVWATDELAEDATTPSRNPSVRGNTKVQRLLRESIVTLPSKLAKRLNTRGRMTSVMDRQTQMQPMVQIIEGRGEDADNASIGDGTVISVERSSILVQDRILYGDLDEGDIDLQSIDRAKQYVSNGESWAEKSARMLQAAQAEERTGVQLEIASCMAKSNDDLRQEVFVMQMIHYYKSVFAQAKLPLWLKTYRILSTSNSTGLIEVLVDATSLDGLKKSKGYPTEGGLRKYFEMVYGPPDSAAFLAAQTNFMQSLAAYALVSYLLGLKDRHNGNIMIDTRGHLIFIDFGFAFGMAPGHEFSFERAPFKLTQEYIDVMGGTRSECYQEFERLFVAGFEECRRNSQIALGLVEIMMFHSNYPCFSGSRYGKGRALPKFERRMMLRLPEPRVPRRARRLIRQSRKHFGTYLYDAFQKATNGYAI
jgi:phosphatidylinositol 4-kinase A